MNGATTYVIVLPKGIGFAVNPWGERNYNLYVILLLNGIVSCLNRLSIGILFQDLVFMITYFKTTVV